MVIFADLHWKNMFFHTKNTDNNNNNNTEIFFDALAMKATAPFIREITSGPNQAHNLTNIFYMNVLSNMLLEGQLPGFFSMFPTSYLHGGSLQLELVFQTSGAQVLICGPCRLLSRNSVQTKGGLSLEQVRLKM